MCRGKEFLSDKSTVLGVKEERRVDSESVSSVGLSCVYVRVCVCVWFDCLYSLYYTQTTQTAWMVVQCILVCIHVQTYTHKHSCSAVICSIVWYAECPHTVEGFNLVEQISRHQRGSSLLEESWDYSS
jgi:hypothetical protein